MIVNCNRRLFDVYIGRPGNGQNDSPFGNPVVAGRKCLVCGQIHAKHETLGCYRTYLYTRTEKDPDFRSQVLSLRGKTLGCFCPGPSGLTLEDDICCHGQIILAWLKENT